MKTVRSKPSSVFYVALIAIFVGGAGILYVMASRASAVRQPTRIDPTLLAGTKAEGYLLGRPDAPVQVAEFGDFECPLCANFAVVTEPDVRRRLVDSGLVALRYYDFPLPMHRNTWSASHAAACANEQGKFWPMHDRLYEGQMEWNSQATGDPRKVMKGYAGELGLNVDQWSTCFDEQKYALKIEANRAEGDRRRVNGTPTFYIGDRMLDGTLTYDALRKVVDQVLAERKSAAPAPAGKAPTGRKGPPG
ncbi:MAG: DsbA family protein [Gemmatimonadetes bacterium]|nr:DsbA family protein [Gemmatimonadota bacterium]